MIFRQLFEPGPLFDSSLCQALVTLPWTLTAIATMILAARSAHRPRWFAGFGLLAVALLVLAASYFASMPPKGDAGAT